MRDAGQRSFARPRPAPGRQGTRGAPRRARPRRRRPSHRPPRPAGRGGGPLLGPGPLLQPGSRHPGACPRAGSHPRVAGPAARHARRRLAEEEQVALVRDIVGSQEPIRFPDGPTGDQTEYHTANELFSRVDAWALQAMLRHLRPRRVIEVGSGWSSLVTARVQSRVPRRTGRYHVHRALPLRLPDGRRRGHEPPHRQSGPGSAGEAVPGPRLRRCPLHRHRARHQDRRRRQVPVPRGPASPGPRGGAVHIHDIFLPWDYPEDWVSCGPGLERAVPRAVLSGLQ